MDDQSISKCPVMHGSATQNSGISTTNRDWWPNQLNINILHQNDKRSNPMSTEFDYREEFKKLEGDKKWDPYQSGIPENIQKKLTKRYKEIFELFVKHHDKISRVTFWGTTDKYTWRNENPIRGRTDFPLLFDREYNKKPAYFELLNIDPSAIK